MNIKGNIIRYNGDSAITITGTGCIITGNRLENNLYGVTFNNVNAAVMYLNSIVNNSYQAYCASYPSGKINAKNNWWGSNNRPSGILGNINVNKWIVIHLTIVTNLNDGNYSVKADLCHDSAGNIISSKGHIRDGTIIKFNTSQGSISSSAKTVGGIAVSTLKTTEDVGSSSIKISAVLDNQTVSKLVYC